MAVTRSKRSANNKWDKENMKIVACKVKKEQAERFKAYADENSSTPNALLKSYICKCIGDNEEEQEEPNAE
jgi:hypothetical protein